MANGKSTPLAVPQEPMPHLPHRASQRREALYQVPRLSRLAVAQGTGKQ
jgi:hypothetical protein